MPGQKGKIQIQGHKKANNKVRMQRPRIKYKGAAFGRKIKYTKEGGEGGEGVGGGGWHGEGHGTGTGLD